ncbi:endolytic transglycosylase MltG [Gordonia oryzae]|uniref:endolytic transglycosylase MltG n=1 Tax=Gordonia oryzae TaxID=2487349 RepID=UPI001FE5A3B2|nr:endolytic transglycosylase MltG [Gordonia oryzae]
MQQPEPQQPEPQQAESQQADVQQAEPQQPQPEPERIDGDDSSARETTDRSVGLRWETDVAPGALAGLAEPTLAVPEADTNLTDRADTESRCSDNRVDHDLTAPHDLIEPADDTILAPVSGDSRPDLDDHPERRPAAVARRRRRRIGMAVVAVVLLALVAGVGYWGADKAGLFDSRKDYSDAAGIADVLVHVPANASIKQIGRILVDDNVVGSVRAFVDAADGASLPSGYYKLRTQIPAREAVRMITDSDSTNRVGRIVVPPGTPLDTKRDTSGRLTPGIFATIADQTGVEINGQRLGVTEQQLSDAAATANITALGVPSWAQDSVTALNGDHRRIEGLIAPGTWEDIDPHDNATQILNALITKSALMYEGWGVVSKNKSGLSPYQTLVAASLLQGEVQPDDYPKVARVILNRLAKGQRLEFDSTANYTASVVDLNLHDDALKADTPWNTYVRKGLPPTPIGAVEEPSVEAMEQPADGNWLYFVTVDSKGTTLFTDDFDQHRRNIATACQNKFITCR